jgi:hypothetical protein
MPDAPPPPRFASLQEHAVDKLAPLGISMSLRLVGVANKAKKPGPVFAAVAREAYAAGADYFYRVNDDSQMLHTWTSAFVRTLQVH